MRAVTEASVEWGVKYLSVFAFSEENWGRPEAEVSTLMKLMFDSMMNELPTFLNNGVKFRVLGNRERLSKSLNEAIDAIEQKTAGGGNLTLILFLSYSGKWDVFQAAKKMAYDLKDNPDREPEPEDFEKYLVTAGIPDPEVIIRTSGEKRLSNYLLWQSAYSEFVFTDVLWPDFRKEQYRAALEEYASRDRRFGKVK